MSRAPAVAGKRRPADAYPTPPWVTRLLLHAVQPMLAGLGHEPSFFEPAAGRGHIVRELRAAYPTSRITAWELDGSATHELSDAGKPVPPGSWEMRGCIDSLVPTDYRTGEPIKWPRADVCVMNPPFSAAEAFVEKALAADIPIVCVLERLSWLCAAKSRQFLGVRTPSVLALSNRPSFAHCCYYGPGKSDFVLVPYDQPSPEGTIRRRASADMSEYGWFVWEPTNAARVVVLPQVPAAVRSEGSWKPQAVAA